MNDDSQATRILSRDAIVNSAIVPGSILRERYRLDSEIGRRRHGHRLSRHRPRVAPRSGGENRWQRCDLDQLVIPQSMKEAIGSRLDRVSPEANEVLRAGAVLGKAFTFAELQSASGEQTEDALLDALDEAVGAQLIAANRSDSFTCTNSVIGTGDEVNAKRSH
ncbi:MAG: hypothetical protein QOF62_1857 [Pyrinomonadaceae bacterium]|jgi:hypothetical protein|nr:hypothetical protein [Pyrinomonadaceae bacterium]